MKYSLIAAAMLAASGQPAQLDDGETLPVGMTNSELPPEVAEVAEALEKIAESARYDADPRKPAADLARLLAAYFRTPDSPAPVAPVAPAGA